MNPGLRFLVAARLCEIQELKHLAQMSELVSVVCRLVHGLQKERGLSNLYLGSRGLQSGDALRQQQVGTTQAQAALMAHLDALDTDAGRERHGARLFSRIAFVLHDLQSVPELRTRVSQQAATADEATIHYTRLISGLLNVVFEAADTATDPQISRALVALFHFVQGKEYAGQERAQGSAAYASGRIDAAHQAQWQALIEAQENCLRVFQEFSPPEVRQAWADEQPAEALSGIERLRRIAGAQAAVQGLDPASGQVWYDLCTRRMDAMKRMEDRLAAQLRELCARRIEQAGLLLRDQQAVVHALQQQARDAGELPPTLLGPQLERSVLGLVQDQSRRIQDMADELETAREALSERKVIERAKGLLMTSRKIGEDEAYKMLRQTAMNQGRKLVDVARSVIHMADYL